MSKIVRLVIAQSYKGKNVESALVYNLSDKKYEIITPKDMKEKYKGGDYSTLNANLGFFVNSIDFTIGESDDYPVFREREKNGNKIYNVERGIVVYEANQEDNEYKSVVVYGEKDKIKVVEKVLSDKDLIKAKEEGNKGNYKVVKGKIVMTYKENSKYYDVSLEEETKKQSGRAELYGKWYQIDERGRLSCKKNRKCDSKTFTIPSMARIIDGFSGSDIEEVDLSGAKIICKDAFRDCKKLKKVIFNDNLEEVQSGAFAGCNMLKELHFPKSLECLGKNIFNNGEVWLDHNPKVAIMPFGATVKVHIANDVENGNLEVALFDAKDKEKNECIVGYNINKENVEQKGAFLKKKSEIGLKKIVNYDNENRKTYGKNTKSKQVETIIFGKSGIEYATIDIKGNIEVKSFEELKKEKLCNGYVEGREIIQKGNIEWQQVKLVGKGQGQVDKDRSNEAKNMAKYMAKIYDEFGGINDKQFEAISEFYSYLFITRLGGKKVYNCKSEEVKRQYPGLVWMPCGYKPGGDPKSNNKDWRRCYFGEALHHHYKVGGFNKDGKMEVLFTFGDRCLQEFLDIDSKTISKIVSLTNIIGEEIKEISKYFANKGGDKLKEKVKLCYEIIDKLKKDNNMDLLGEMEKHINNYDKVGLPYTELMVQQISRVLSNGKCEIDEENFNEYEDFRCGEVISRLVKDKATVLTCYENPILKLKNDFMVYDSLKKFEQTIISGILGEYGSKKGFENIKEIEEAVKFLKDNIDQNDLKIMQDYVKKFNSLKLEKGLYVLDDRFLVSTQRLFIVDVETKNMFSVDNRSLEENKETWKEFKESIKNGEKRYTNSSIYIKDLSKDTTRSYYMDSLCRNVLREKEYVDNVKTMRELGKWDNLGEKDTCIVFGKLPYYGWRLMGLFCDGLAIAGQDIGYVSGNSRIETRTGQKLVYKDGEILYKTIINQVRNKQSNLVSINVKDYVKLASISKEGRVTIKQSMIRDFMKQHGEYIVNELNKMEEKAKEIEKELKYKKTKPLVKENVEKLFKTNRDLLMEVMKDEPKVSCGISVGVGKKINAFIDTNRMILNYSVDPCGDKVDCRIIVTQKGMEENNDLDRLIKIGSIGEHTFLNDYLCELWLDNNKKIFNVKNDDSNDKFNEAFEELIFKRLTIRNTCENMRNIPSDEIDVYKDKDTTILAYDEEATINSKAHIYKRVKLENIGYTMYIFEFGVDYFNKMIKKCEYYTSKELYKLKKDSSIKEIEGYIEEYRKKEEEIAKLGTPLKETNAIFDWLDSDKNKGKTIVIYKENGEVQYVKDDDNLIGYKPKTIYVKDKVSYKELGNKDIKGMHFLILNEKVELIDKDGELWKYGEDIKKQIEEKNKELNKTKEEGRTKFDYVKKHEDTIEEWGGQFKGLYKDILSKEYETLSPKQLQTITKYAYSLCVKKFGVDN